VLLLGQFPRLVVQIDIIPAIGAERIDHQRRTEQKTDLGTIQACLQARDIFLIQRIALLHIDVIGADARHGAAR